MSAILKTNTSPVRILHVFASLDRGGAEAMVMSVYRAIDRTKVQFDFVVNDRDKPYAHEDEIQQLGGNVFRVPRYMFRNHCVYKRAWNTLLVAHPEWSIIHGHHTSPALVYMRVAKSHGRLTIAHSHINGGITSLKSTLKRVMRYSLRYQADILFACSHSAAEWMFGSRSARCRTINNAIDAHQFKYDRNARKRLREELGLGDRFVVGHIGRFALQKNHQFLLEIFQELRAMRRDALLLLVGEGELRRNTENEVARLGLKDHVLFVGSRPDVPELLSAMDIFVFPSLFEGLGIVAVEAQAAGLRCVVSDAVPKDAFLSDLIERESLTAAPEIWAQRILGYADGYERADTTAQIVAAGFDISGNVKMLGKFYLEACGSRESE